MPWALAILRGQKVYARVTDGGAFVADGGRVEIRYKPTDGRAYRAAAGNLERIAGSPLMPDDACAPAVAAPEAPRAAAGGAGGAGAAKSASRGRAVGVAPARAKDDWIAYTDGACSGNPGPAGSGVVVIRPDGQMFEGYSWLGTGTNNIAELTAILDALAAIPRDAPGVLVHTDSQYAIGVLTKGWKAKANQDLIRDIKASLALRPRVHLIYVPGHAGVPLNERADELAREAIRVRKSSPITFST